MPETVRQVRGDERTSDLAAMNEKEIFPASDELIEFSQRNPIYIFNVSTESFTLHHPLVGKLTINACKEGEAYSEPTILPGLIPNGVPVEMKTVELRHESGRQFVVDILGIGPFKKQDDSLLRRGVFIASDDTFDAADVTNIRLGKSNLSLPRWVDMRYGKCAKKPTKMELEKANQAVAQWDHAKIAEADRYWDNGPANKEEGTGNIRAEHRLALRRRGQVRDWDKPQETLTDCQGCGEKIRPNVIVHTCGAVRDWDKAIALGMKKAEDRPQPKKSA
jgi:hypothetical protein